MSLRKIISVKDALKLLEDLDSPCNKRRMDSDDFLLRETIPEAIEIDGYLLGFNRQYSAPIKVKRKSRLESAAVPNIWSETGKVGKENVILIKPENNRKENEVLVSDEQKSENEDKIPSLGENPAKPELKVIDLTNGEDQNASAERATWLDARTTCRLYNPKDTRGDKENDAQQLKVIAPSFLEKRNFSLGLRPEFRGNPFSTTAKQLPRPRMSGSGAASSLKRPNSNSIGASRSDRSSLGGGKLQMLDESIRLEEKEKYSELLQSYSSVPVKRPSVRQIKHEKSPLIPFASRARRTYGNKKVELIDLTHHPDSKDDTKTTSVMLGNMGDEASGLTKPILRSGLKEKLDKCDVYDVSWIEDLNKMYNRKDRECRKQIMNANTKAALCTQKNNQLLDEVLEERMRVHMRLTEVAVEEGPVPLAEDEEPLPELTPAMEKRISYAFKSGPGGEVLSEGFSLRITRRDMHTLVGTNWLNDEVINFYMNLLIERGKLDNYPSVYCFNTFFYPKLETQGHASLKRWTRKIDIFANEMLIVPVHLGVHWCLSCINLKEKRIYYLDSMGGKNYTCLQTLMKYLQDEHMDKKKYTFNTTGWSTHNVKDNPQQMNGSDCGMFSCMYAEYLCRRAKISFSQKDMPYFRRKMAYEILTKKLML